MLVHSKVKCTNCIPTPSSCNILRYKTIKTKIIESKKIKKPLQGSFEHGVNDPYFKEQMIYLRQSK